MKRILGEYLIGEPPLEEDAERNTDLIVLHMDAVRIGCRVRRHEYLRRYGNEFTIREGRPSGIKTELAKIVEGWGDYFLYAFADQDAQRLVKWTLGDMKVFRLWFNRQLVIRRGAVPGFSKPNNDGSSNFRAFQVSDLPDAFVVAQSPCASLTI